MKTKQQKLDLEEKENEYICPMRGCNQKNIRFSIIGLCRHILDHHGELELQERLRARFQKSK